MAFEGVEVLLDEADARGEPPGGVAGDRVRREALVHQRLVDEGDRSAPAEADHEVPVLDRGGVLVEAAELEDDVAAHDEGLGRDHVGEEQRREDVALGREDRRVGHVAQPQPLAGPVVEAAEGQEAAVGADEAGPGGGQPRHLLGELGRQPFVVAVLEGDPGAAGLGDAEVAGAGGALVARARDQPQPRVLDLGRGGQRAVGRAVVDDERARSRSRSGAARSRWRRGSRRRGCRPGSPR